MNKEFLNILSQAKISITNDSFDYYKFSSNSINDEDGSIINTYSDKITISGCIKEKEITINKSNGFDEVTKGLIIYTDNEVFAGDRDFTQDRVKYKNREYLVTKVNFNSFYRVECVLNEQQNL